MPPGADEALKTGRKIEGKRGDGLISMVRREDMKHDFSKET